ncbi:LuxR C-terminal-related transcriptional regulator [Mycobacterium cookii]|uniref:Transcriptional regulator n=1 Tax=Mycobacterium cookii TaxID=1775 RepID=A0A7I7KYH9_9MYCO|nr:LuxR family transcriptional regulator [Mycobacterium cookii]MCV7331572.1 helix-turn-helix transcriptional regulator [Mycobacterium cookii]BBX46864.1 transcriptional regulator [Mycobacterium cookii]
MSGIAVSSLVVDTRSWPIVRREDEFGTIRSALAGTQDFAGIVLFGDAGVGKTTLARAVTQSLPTPVHWVAGTESARSIPLGVFAHLVGPAASRDPIAGLAAARETIRSAEHSIIGVDDAHLLDHLSATLVHQLALEGSVRIVAAVRDGETVPDAITSLWKDGYLKRLRLTPFSKTQCLALVEEALGGRLEGLSGDLMWTASCGNALYIRHLVEGALEAGTLRQVRGVWQLRGRTAVTSELASLLDARIEQLPEDEAHTLQLLAFAEPLSLDTLSTLVGPDTVEGVERRGLIRVVEDSHTLDVRFTHPLYGEVIRRGLGRAATRRLKGELFSAMHQQPVHAPAQRIRLAELALDSDSTADSELFAAAAHDAIALTNITLGERLARASVERGGGLVASELLARSLLWQGRAAEAEDVLNAFDPDSMNELELVRWGMARIANLHWSMGDAARADEVLHLLQRRVSHPALRLVVEGVASATRAFENLLDEAAVASQRVLDDATASPWALIWAVFGGTLAAALAGRVDDAAAIVERGRQIENELDSLLRYPTMFGEIRALTLAGEFDDAEARSGHIGQISSPGQYLAWGMSNILLGAVEVARGRFDLAAPRMEETVAALAAESAASWSFPAAMLLAQSHCVLGNVDAAAKTVNELRGKVGRHVAVFEPQFRLVEAWLAAAEGHVSGAISRALEAADLARDSGQRAVEMVALHDAARFGDLTSLQRLVDIAHTIGGRLAAPLATYGAALLSSDADELCSAAEQFESIGALLSAADAAAQAAALFRAADDRRHAQDCAATADRLAAACGGVHTPALEMASQPLPLSPREREIASFVSQGLSNRDIADRLVVSTRTVEGHIYRACIKLDVTDREGLALVIRRGRGD